MDPAQQIDMAALQHQNAMNSVIDLYQSPVQQFYKDATVFMTGGSGFIGKQLIEKIFRSCQIKKMYLLSRSKRGKTMMERLQNVLKDPVFDLLREKQPQFEDLIVPVEGDVTELKLGLSDHDWKKLTSEVTIIFHVAATVRFNEPLRLATLTNVRGTREALALAKQCSNFKKFIHISTAFTHATSSRINEDVEELFYPCPVPPDVMIELAETVEEKRLDGCTAGMIENWPNTYTFTKALAEELLRVSAGDIPVCIVRPSIVLPAYYEPSPGWIDLSTLFGPSGLYFGAGMGVIHVARTDKDALIAMAPVDYVNNAIIAAGWDSELCRHDSKDRIPIYTIKKECRFGLMVDILYKEKNSMVSPRAVYKSGTIQIKNDYLYYFVATFLHYIPAYFLDFVLAITGTRPKEIPSVISIYKKMDRLWDVYKYFVYNHWNFKMDNLQKMYNRMNSDDKAIFNCDVNTVDTYEYVLVWGVGLRKYILKDGLKGTERGRRKQQMFAVLNFIIIILYGYVLWYVASTVFALVKNIILILC